MTPNLANRLAIALSVTAALLLCAFATGRQCSVSEPAPAAPYAVTAEVTVPATETVTIPTEVNADDDLNKVRQAARDLVKSAFPNVKQDGVFTLTLRHGDLYIAGVDTAEGNKKRTVDVLVRRYVRKNGAAYYRAESLTPEQAARYAEMAE
jgi:hypothetical protein